MLYGLLPTGFQPKTAQNILDELLDDVEGGLGVTLDRTTESTVVRLLGTYAETLAGAWETANQLWLAGDPGQAADLALDDLVAAVGLRRLFATPSQVDALCIGRAGTTLPAGQIASADGARFVSTEDATLEERLWYGRVDIKRVVAHARYGATLDGVQRWVTANAGESASDLAKRLANAWKVSFPDLMVEARGDGVDLWARQTDVTPALLLQVSARQRLNVILCDLVAGTRITLTVKSGGFTIATAEDTAGSATTPAVVGTVIANLAARISRPALAARPGADGRSIDIDANVLGTNWTVELGPGAAALSFSDQTPSGLATLTTKQVGGALVRFESVETGPVPALADHLIRIETPLSGWDRVTNTAPADLGRRLETDRALRGRLSRSRYILATGVAGAIEARLRQDIAGLRAVRVIENDADTTDAAGRPPHSFEVVVDAIAEPATDLATARLIESLRPVSVPAVSSAAPDHRVEVSWQDDHGTMRTVCFSRPTPVPIYLEIRLTAHPDEVFPVGAESILKDRILLWGQAHSIGQDVVIGRMLALLHAFAGVGQIDFLVAGRTSTGTPGNINIGPIEIAHFDSANIVLHPPV